jgi:heme-degrading monooxygenase HmoA
MVVVIFEVTLKSSEAHRYFDLAAELRPELDGIDGFVSVERFKSLVNEGKYLSLSFWRDRASVDRWRRHAGHKIVQSLGRREIFADFRITVADAFRSYRMAEPSPHAGEPAASA